MEKKKTNIFWEKLIKSKFVNNKVRLSIGLSFPIAISVLAAFITYRVKLFAVLILVIFIVYLAIELLYVDYDKYINDNKEDLKRKYQELQNENAKLKAVNSFIQPLLTKNADGINRIYHNISQQNTYKEKDWNYKETCTIVCHELYDMFKKNNSNDDEVEVSYISFEYKKGEKSPIAKMTVYRNGVNIHPTIYKKEIVIADKKQEGEYYFIKYFRRYHQKKSAEPVVFCTENEIKKNFYISNPGKAGCKYKQYIAIPVSCDENKVIGLLQVVSFKENLFGIDESEIQSKVIKIIKSVDSLLLLSNKTDKCIKALVEKGEVNHEKAA